MQTLESGADKIKKICDTLRKETLEPAEKEAASILAEAKEEAARIRAKAEEEKARLIEEAKENNQRERAVFESTLDQAAKQAVEALRQRIEKELFSEELNQMVVQSTKAPEVVAGMITSLVSSIEREGLNASLEAAVAAGAEPETVQKALSASVAERLQKGFAVGDFEGGVCLRLEEGKNKITVDLSNKAVHELLWRYVRNRDFRKLLYQE